MYMPESNTVSFGSAVIGYNVERRRRKTLAISVVPSGNVVVYAPADAPEEKIREKVHKKAPWILRQKWYFGGFGEEVPVRRYVSGETHRYMGRQYRLKVYKDSANSVKLIGGYITVRLPEKDAADSVKSLVDKWYRYRAEVKLPEIVDRCADRLKAFGIPRPEIKFKTFAKRWGSYTRQGRMWLNVDLIKAPLACIEYVITHELCHYKEHNHGKEFFRLLNKVMPDWQKRKEQLERVMSGV